MRMMTDKELDSFDPTREMTVDELTPGKIVYAGQFTLPAIILGKLKGQDAYSLRVFNAITGELWIGSYDRDEITPFWPIANNEEVGNIIKMLKEDFNKLLEVNYVDESIESEASEIPIDDSW